MSPSGLNKYPFLNAYFHRREYNFYALIPEKRVSYEILSAEQALLSHNGRVNGGG